MNVKAKGIRAVASVAVVIAVVVAGAVLYLFRQEVFGSPKKPDVTRHVTERSAWLADWRGKAGLTDLGAVAGGLTSLQVFAAYFTPEGKLHFTDAFHAMLPDVRSVSESNGLNGIYLTLVNDIVYPDGTESQKDPALVTMLTADRAVRGAHIDEIVAAAVSYGFDGIELDYERVGEKDWPNFVQLVRELQTRLKAEGLALRVVFEPRAPLEKLELPEGPVYVMMAYNLYGGHSGPGPKADVAYVEKQANRMRQLAGNSYVALAAGGFDWLEGTKGAKAVTELAAEQLAERYGAKPLRDPKSAAMHFSYAGDDGKHTVWYADGTTLSSWIEAAEKKGIYNIAIWRLDELGEDSLSAMKASSRLNRD